VTATYLTSVATVLGLMLAVLVLLRLARRRGISFARENPIALLASRTVGANTNLVMVEVEGQRLLLGISRGGINLLHALPQKPTAAILPFDTPFSAVLKRAAG